jgi:hypothetical protein
MGWQVVYVPFLFAGNTIINQNGIFVYNGTPAHGNLKASISGSSGTDDFGNAYIDNIAAYNTAGNGNNFIQIAVNPTTGTPFLVLEVPGNPTNNPVPPQINAGAVNAGAANEQTQLVASSGNETLPGAAGAAFLQLASRSNDSTVQSTIQLSADDAFVVLKDGNVAFFARYNIRVPSTITINSTSPQAILTVPNVSPVNYRLHCQITYLGGAVAANAGLSWGGTATVSNMVGTLRRARGSTNVDNVLPVNQNSVLGALAFPFAIGELCTYEFDGTITFSAGGTFIIQGNEGTAGDTWAVATNSYLELMANQ